MLIYFAVKYFDKHGAYPKIASNANKIYYYSPSGDAETYFVSVQAKPRSLDLQVLMEC
ncbi:hypothetical protein GCM10011357_34710 [Lacimicrobium alkaliphilum]|uniref:Uncharacterized protein n=1 Tax=Lacimicrobium alkaliphilum TaxID=1526571 RepID=A0ABQ1RSL1_9ALTE|nr:hypothetical protein GCM10011357_34710 [Lacimicrobium alkaliphilum]